jgi:integrase
MFNWEKCRPGVDPDSDYMENRINFTKRKLEALPSVPQGRRQSYYDIKVAGLELRVTPAGTKTFTLYRRIEGRPERVTLGRFPQMTIDQARNEATKLNGRVSSGKNSAEEKRSVRTEITLKEMFVQYLERHSKVHKRTWEEDQGRYNKHLKKWNNRKLSSITRTDIQKLHTSIGAAGSPYSANRILSLLSIIFNKAIEWGWEGNNPVNKITKFKEKSRDRFLQGDELPRFFKSLSIEPHTTARDFFLSSLLTGARRANVLAMRWDELNFERKTWLIPRTKNGTSQTIPLVPEVLDILINRKEASDGSEWVFSSNTSKTGHLVEPKKAWKRVLDRAGIKDLRMHDLRRSLGSWQAATGANLSIIGKTLNHQDVATTAIYARLNIDPVRVSMEKAVSAMFSAGEK